MHSNNYNIVFDDSLQHHGIKGQVQGVRNGDSYPLKFEEHSAAEIAQNPSSILGKVDDEEKKKLRKESGADFDGDRVEKRSEQERSEKDESPKSKKLSSEEKKEILARGDAEEIRKNREQFTTNEINEALNRISAFDRLNDVANKSLKEAEQANKAKEEAIRNAINAAVNIGDVKALKTLTDSEGNSLATEWDMKRAKQIRNDRFASRVNQTAENAKKFVSLYNVGAAISNSIFDTTLPKINLEANKTVKNAVNKAMADSEKARKESIEKAMRSGNQNEIAKVLPLMKSNELDELNKKMYGMKSFVEGTYYTSDNNTPPGSQNNNQGKKKKNNNNQAQHSAMYNIAFIGDVL